ncbi:MAG TPA: superoxide dismutase family protein [Bacteroidia bacterium]|jgi:Cu-Zn family superoxide dismutase|nr:superoxide dismutase family protein [Bacteroidia bacterium]HRG53625.1 superoxide dismutase family protein [Bacteroidia bacterium]
MKKSFKKISFQIIAFGMLLSIPFYACKKKDKEVEEEHKTATATLQGVYNDTLVTGTASFMQMGDGDVTLKLDVTVPSRANKSIAVHFHMMNDCGGNANNAMGHWNPTGASHGKWGSASYHIGDIGNINLDASGHALFELTTNQWNINGDDATRNVVGHSIIIHSGVDDYTSQPSGNSGTRIGCGSVQ